MVCVTAPTYGSRHSIASRSNHQVTGTGERHATLPDHHCGMNLIRVMRDLVGVGTPRGLADQHKGLDSACGRGLSRGFGSLITNLAFLVHRWFTNRFAAAPRPHNPRAGPAIAGTR